AGIYHAVGAAAMGAADDAVVDAALRVRGVTGLRVADASVLPAQVFGNTAAPAMVIGWRAADLIRETGLPRAYQRARLLLLSAVLRTGARGDGVSPGERGV